MKKRLIALLCVLAMLGTLAACGGKEGDGGTSAQDKTPGAESTGNIPSEEVPSEYKTYKYEKGAITVSMPHSFEGEPVEERKSLVIADPNGAWTIEMTPLTYQERSLEADNIPTKIEGQKGIGFYLDTINEERTYGEFKDLYCSFNTDTNWDYGRQGYPFGERESHAYHIIDYGDVMIGEWAGLKIEVTATEASTVIEELMADETVSVIVNKLAFEEGKTSNVTAIGGLSAEFPAKWRAGSKESTSIWAAILGDTTGTIYFTFLADPDAEERGSYISDAYQTVEWGGHTWYGDAKLSEVGGSSWYSMQMFTPYDEERSINLTLYINDAASTDDMWAYTKTAEFTDVLNSLQFDPASYITPADPWTDENGFRMGGQGEIAGYTGEATEIVIPTEINGQKVYGIGGGAFEGNTKITSVIIPEGVNRVMPDAFKDCTSLKSVVLPNSLNYIDFGGFSGCTALENVDLGRGIKTIGTAAFIGCTSLETIEFGDNIKRVEGNAFAECTALKDVILPATIVEIGKLAFDKAGSGEGVFESFATGAVYGENCFRDASFKEITFGPSSDLSAMGVLEGTKVKKVTIGEGTTALGERFMYAGFMTENETQGDTTPLEVILPASLQSIGDSAFVKRYGLTNIDLPKGLTALGFESFAECGLTQISIPGSVKEIPEYCFSYCSDLGVITMEEGVEVIGKKAFKSAGYRDSEGYKYYVYLTDADAQEESSRIKEGGRLFVRMYTPSTLKRIEDYAFDSIWFEGLFMEWCTDPSMLPDCSEKAWSSIRRLGRAYFSKDTVSKYGDQLTAYFKERIENVDKVESDYGAKCYWMVEDRPDSTP